MKMKIILKMKKKSHIYDIDRPRTRHWQKYPKYKMSHYNDGYMY